MDASSACLAAVTALRYDPVAGRKTLRLNEGEFPSATENAELKDAITREIAAQGRITFRRFMALALYHPQHGYYCSPRQRMGRHGDYLTSPEVHPIFGSLVAKQLCQMWQAMGQPQPFAVVEMGAGSGLLARDILRWARRQAPEFFQALEYCLVEVNEWLVEDQRRLLCQVDESLAKVSWLPSLDAIAAESVSGCFLSNELVDSFPVHRVTVRDGQLYEVYVEWQDGRFVESLGPPSTPLLQKYFRRMGLLPGEGCTAEVNLEALEWMRAVARALGRGFVLTFDYGYPAAELYAPWRKDGTLLCFYRHNPSTDPYARLGRQDMTSHVDFTSLVQAGREHGLEPLGLTSQSRFLMALGIAGGLEHRGAGELTLEEHYARRRAVTELIDPAGLGRIKVLVQAKGVGQPNLWGLEESEP
ncbi:MAG: class I SAM-dependent methyltransferase [Dehalococcoidia bacterium]